MSNVLLILSGVFFNWGIVAVQFGSSLYLQCLYLTLNIWHTIITITVLTSFSANSNVCISSESVLIDYAPYYGSCFPEKAFLILFGWISDIVNFILLVAGYFCIPTNLLELCSWMHLIFLEIVSSFQVLLL